MLTQTQETTLIDVKNKWVWKGCLEKDVNDDYLSEYVRKFYLVKGTSTPWIICEKHLKLHAIQNKEHSSNKDMF